VDRRAEGGARVCVPCHGKLEDCPAPRVPAPISNCAPTARSRPFATPTPTPMALTCSRRRGSRRRTQTSLGGAREAEGGEGGQCWGQCLVLSPVLPALDPRTWGGGWVDDVGGGGWAVSERPATPLARPTRRVPPSHCCQHGRTDVGQRLGAAVGRWGGRGAAWAAGPPRGLAATGSAMNHPSGPNHKPCADPQCAIGCAIAGQSGHPRPSPSSPN
jgi:hypothetical protein